jgi:2'-5' RNA ligase
VERPALPPRLPAGLGDAAVIFANDWDAFRQLDSINDHWDRAEWADGGRAYFWFLLFGADEPVRAAAAHAWSAVDLPTFDPVPLDDLHLTLLRIGDEAAIAPPELDKVIEAGAAACATIPPFRLTIGPLTGSTEAIRFSVTPWRELVRLEQRLHDATAGALNQAHLEVRDPFRPHISVGYANRAQPARPVIDAVATVRGGRAGGHPAGRPGGRPAGAVVRAAHVVLLRREDRRYAWDVCASATLGRHRVTTG